MNIPHHPSDRTEKPSIWRRLLAVLAMFLLIWLVVVVGLGTAVFVLGNHNEVTAGQSGADVIIVLGSGLRRDGRPGDALYRRSVWGSRLFDQGVAPAVICTGGIGDGQQRSEASACQEVLEAHGVPADAVFLEERSRSTEQNAIFAHEIMEDHGWDQAIVVTDSFHMLRASWIFGAQDISHYRSPVPRDWVRSHWYIRHFARELAALHWQAIKETLNLPVTQFRRF